MTRLSEFLRQESYETKDSGERMEFETGSRRDTQTGKPRYDLIGPEGLERLAALMARGAEKYGENNWRLGQKASRYYASMFRHMMQWAQGDNTEDHLAAVCFNAFGIMHLEAKFPQHLDHERYGANTVTAAEEEAVDSGITRAGQADEEEEEEEADGPEIKCPICGLSLLPCGCCPNRDECGTTHVW